MYAFALIIYEWVIYGPGSGRALISSAVFSSLSYCFFIALSLCVQSSSQIHAQIHKHYSLTG